MSQRPSTEETPNWLQSIEHNSWQIELLISGGLILTLYTIPDSINDYLAQVMNNTSYGTSHLILFIMAFVVSKALLIGFAINLTLRALWLALLGVHFAYPQGIRYDRLDYSEEFEAIDNTKSSTVSKIMWFEKWASLSYSIAFMLSVLSIGAILIVVLIYRFVFEPFFPYSMLSNEVLGYVILGIVMLFSLGFFDWIFFRAFKGSRRWTKIYAKISKLISIFNLTFIFKREWLTLVSNNSRWKIYTIIISYFVIALVFTLNDIEATDDLSRPTGLFDERAYLKVPTNHFSMDNDEYDEHLKPGDFISEVSIPSEVISDNLLSVFVSYSKYYDRILRHYVDSLGVTSDWHKIPNGKYGEVLVSNQEKLEEATRQFIRVRIDTTYIGDIEWMYRSHPQTNQEGWTTRIDISSLDRGKHSLSIIRQDIGPTGNKGFFTVRWIPFWKD